MSDYAHVLGWVQSQVWALEPGFAERALTVLQSRILNGPSPRQAAAAADRTRGTPGTRSSVAVLSLQGVLSQRLGMVEEACSLGTSTDAFQRSFHSALADPNVSAIVLNVDSPGGSVYGVQETWQTIFNARGSKPIISQINSLAASAAYWISTAADQIVMTPSGEAGSIGVFALHLDQSRAVDKAGITPTFISAGRYKVEGNSLQPLTTEAAQAVQDSVNRYYRAFLSNVAKGRGTTPSIVELKYGEGRTVGSQQALRAGMVDKIQPLNATLAELIRAGRSAKGMGATSDAMRRARQRRRMLNA